MEFWVISVSIHSFILILDVGRSSKKPYVTSQSRIKTEIMTVKLTTALTWLMITETERQRTCRLFEKID